MKLIHAPYISQKNKYPTGCESVSAVMLLQYLGINITVEEFIYQYLDCCPFEIRDGQLYGADPRKYFCGSPYQADDFGCYAPVIHSALKKVFCSLGDTFSTDYEVIDETDTPTEHLLHKYIDHDLPLIYWACIDMKEPIIGPQWKLSDSGETFTWISNEHCMLLVGYDDDNYYFNDPYENHGLIGYPRDIVENRHKAQYSMAIGVNYQKPRGRD